MNKASTKGYVFNIQRYSVHDGPGIRIIVFLKGCLLSCKWCSNPESQDFSPELAYKEQKCITVAECGWCKKECPANAIEDASDGKIKINRERCIKCFKCVEACPAGALNSFGKEMTVKQVMDEVEADSIFYSRSGGGLTLSGGEPLMQGEFVHAVIAEAKKRRIDATIETCGHADWENLARIAPYLKIILFDIKHMNSEKHEQFTGVPNTLILENFKRLREEFPTLHILVRTPLIPEFNDTEEEITDIMDYIKDIPNVSYELLPYHRMGQQKYEYIDRKYLMADCKLDEEKSRKLQELAKTFKGGK